MRPEGTQEPASEPHAAAQVGQNTSKRHRKETPLTNLLNIMKDAVAAQERRHTEKMALLKKLLATIWSNKA